MWRRRTGTERRCLGEFKGLAADAAMLVFWRTGLQDLACLPHGERLSRGALLWRAARQLWKERGRSASGV